MAKKGVEKTRRLILGIETSCDETAAAVVEGSIPVQKERVKLLSNVVASSAWIQAKYGGIIPEQAAREQLKAIIPVIGEALKKAHCKPQDLDAVAVTYGPGLIGSLLVGVETAKTLSLVWDKPLIPINHLIAHFYANWIKQGPVVSSQEVGKKNKKNQLPATSPQPLPNFPIIGLLVSGGHTDLILMKDHGKYDYLGGTRDDAAGEAFDKCARLLGLSYPGGPQLAKLAERGNPKAFNIPRPMIGSGDFDFSFSGLKTAAANIVKATLQDPLLADLAASIQEAIVDVLVKKTIMAAQKYNIEQIMVAGGVAANKRLGEKMKDTVKREIPKAKLLIPPPYLSTDNAAIVATAAYFNFKVQSPLKVQANPNLSLQHPSPP